MKPIFGDDFAGIQDDNGYCMVLYKDGTVKLRFKNREAKRVPAVLEYLFGELFDELYDCVHQTNRVAKGTLVTMLKQIEA